MKIKNDDYFWTTGVWHRPSGGVITLDYIIKHLKKGSYKKINIGTDSQEKASLVVFVTAVCFETDLGTNYFYVKTRQPRLRFKSIYLRLREEIQRSVLLGNFLRTNLDSKIVVHADINSLPRGYSNRFNKEFHSYVEAMGFDYKCKPLSWAANTVANWHTK